jgi:hypothetical protein
MLYITPISHPYPTMLMWRCQFISGIIFLSLNKGELTMLHQYSMILVWYIIVLNVLF